MREIKFRAWDKEDNRLKRVTLMDFPGWSVCVQNQEEYYEIGDRNSFKNEETDRCILMQYTGLKDKNGVEIYFDDLVRDNDGLVYKVKYGGYFSKDGAGWGVHYYRCIPDTFALDASPFQHELGLEVIGNIWENPELMDG